MTQNKMVQPSTQEDYYKTSEKEKRAGNRKDCGKRVDWRLLVTDPYKTNYTRRKNVIG
jgi:hypothetical protein